MSTPMASRPEPQDAQHPRTRKRCGSMIGCGNNRRPGSATTRDRFRARSPRRAGSFASSLVAVPAVLSGSGRDNPRSTTSSGTRRARSRLRRPPTQSREFVRSTCLYSVAAATRGQDHSAYLPDHGRWSLPTVRSSGRTYPKLPCKRASASGSVAGRLRSPLLVVVAVTVAASRGPVCPVSPRCPSRVLE